MRFALALHHRVWLAAPLRPHTTVASSQPPCIQVLTAAHHFRDDRNQPAVIQTLREPDHGWPRSRSSSCTRCCRTAMQGMQSLLSSVCQRDGGLSPYAPGSRRWLMLGAGGCRLLGASAVGSSCAFGTGMGASGGAARLRYQLAVRYSSGTTPSVTTAVPATSTACKAATHEPWRRNTDHSTTDENQAGGDTHKLHALALPVLADRLTYDGHCCRAASQNGPSPSLGISLQKLRW